MSNTATWVDTGFLVALFACNDTHHDKAKQFLAHNPRLEMHSIWPVIVETCFFLNNDGKQALLQWLERGAIVMHEITPQHLPLIIQTLNNYQNINPDFTDAVLVTMADLRKIRQILTVDVRDFSVYRFKDGSAFERLWI